MISSLLFRIFTNIFVLRIFCILLSLLYSLYFNDILLCEGGSDSSSDDLENKMKDEFVRRCDLASSYEESAKVFGIKLFDLERDEKLLSKDLKDLNQSCIADMLRRNYLNRLKLKASKIGWFDVQIQNYIEHKRNLYRSEESCYLKNAIEQQDIIYKWLFKYHFLRKVDLSKYKFFGNTYYPK